MNSPWISMEIGAAWAWGKAIYIVLSGVTMAEVPASLAHHRTFVARDVPEIVEEVCRNIAPLTEDQSRQLGELYTSLRIPTDQLAARPAALESLTRDFNHREGLSLSPERVLQELIRLRKKGRLPKLRRQTG